MLVATQGQGDEEALDSALRSAAPRVLLIASRRKADKLREAMRQRGVSEAQLAKLQAPAGPDAGAKTPAEIALLAIAGVLGSLRGRPTGTNAQGPRKPLPLPLPLPLPSMAPQPGQFINPVCGMAVQMASATHVETYEGQAYYFCCDGCWVTFRQDPAKYALKERAS